MIAFPVVLSSDARRRSPGPLLVFLLGGIVLLLVLIRNGWVTDDAFITFRSLDNFVRGRGLRWNAAERVQCFTNPLWLFALAPPYALTREPFYTSLAVSMLLALVTAGIVVIRTARNTAAGVLGAILLVGSKAYVDFSVSGLENPLTNVLLAAFASLLLAGPRSGLLVPLSALAAGAALTRLDNLLVVLPGLAWALSRTSVRSGWRGLLPLVLPLAAWEGFSVFYFGFPFPNTAYAKLGVGDLSRWELIERGAFYLTDSLRLDPLTLTAISLAVASAIWKRSGARWALAAGMLLHLGYVVAIGGDFMSGRFLVAAYVMGVALLADLGLPAGPWRWGGLAAASLFALLPSRSPLWSGPSYGNGPGQRDWFHAISDERAQYYDQAGLLAVPWGGGPTHAWVGLGKSFREKPGVYVHETVGYLGYYAGRRVHIVDRMALCEPLLARIPRRSETDPDRLRGVWRVGHLVREVPRGYLTTLETGRNAIEDPQLAKYYDRLALVIRGPLLSPERLVEIWRFNSGAYRGLMQSYVGAQDQHSQAASPPATPAR